MLSLLLVAGLCKAYAGPDFVEAVSKLSLGMTEVQVTDLLGKPDVKFKITEGEVWFFRFSTMTKNDKGGFFKGTNQVLAAIGRVRCHMKDGVLTQIAGFWPKPKRPPSDVPKNKVLLVDVASIYDNIALTISRNEGLKKAEAEFTKDLQKQNEEGRRLLEDHKKATDELAHFKGSEEAKSALKQRVNELKDKVKAKQTEVNRFAEEKRALLTTHVNRYVDVVIPALSDAILLFKTERGYDYVFEINQTILSPGKKPLFVDGVDETHEIVRWIDSGAAKSVGF